VAAIAVDVGHAQLLVSCSEYAFGTPGASEPKYQRLTSLPFVKSTAAMVFT
jgi:hypothetical protein